MRKIMRGSSSNIRASCKAWSTEKLKRSKKRSESCSRLSITSSAYRAAERSHLIWHCTKRACRSSNDVIYRWTNKKQSSYALKTTSHYNHTQLRARAKAWSRTWVQKNSLVHRILIWSIMMQCWTTNYRTNQMTLIGKTALISSSRRSKNEHQSYNLQISSRLKTMTKCSEQW